MAHSLGAMAEVVRAGFFVPVRESTWDFELYFESVDDWGEFLERPSCGGSETDPALIEAAGSDPAGRIVLVQRNLAQLYERG